MSARPHESIRPEATPRVAFRDADQRSDRNRHEPPGDDSCQEERAGRVRPVIPLHGHPGRPQDPHPDHGHPDRLNKPNRGAGDEGLRDDGHRHPGQPRRQPRQARLHRRVSEHLLHVQGAGEKETVEACPEQEADRVGPSKGPQPEQAQRQQRRCGPGLDHHERGQQDRCRHEHDHRPGSRPPDSRRLRDRVDHNQEGAGHGDRAERVVAASRVLPGRATRRRLRAAAGVALRAAVTAVLGLPCLRNHADRRADTPGWTPNSAANVKPGLVPERAPEPRQAATLTVPPGFLASELPLQAAGALSRRIHHAGSALPRGR